ncbi:PQQ-dependent sugar dehydrogenase [Haloferula sp.]|uniref:PQQ-dependent sugar dehydrogenase n=1 Tax=Haloferula sp. TaxID=2497595 RepID=UPI0032A0DD39
MVFRIFAVSCILTGAISPLLGEVIGTDDFSYADTPIDGLQGGGGWDWNEVTTTHTGSVSDWDHLWGGANVQSGELVTSDGGVQREYNGPTDGPGGDEGLGAIRDQGVVFYQVTMRRDATTSWSGISTYDFGQDRLFFGVPGGISATNEVGIEEPGVGITASGITLVDGQDYMFVAVLDYDNNLAGLFVDPDASDSWSSAGGTADVTRVYTAGYWSTATRLASGGDAYYDDLRVVDDWDDLDIGPLVDTDFDGMPDNWEMSNGLVVGVDDSAGDNDGEGGADGLTNLEEYLAGTDPQNSDSDFDGYNDGIEISQGTDPLSATDFPGANLELVGAESFLYPDGGVEGLNGGSFWDFQNTADDVSQVHSGFVSDWTNDFGVPQIIAGKLVTNDSGTEREYYGGGNEADGAFGDPGQFLHKVIYYRFEMTRRAGATWGGASNFDFTTERYLFGIPGAPNPSSGNLEFAIHDLNTDSHSYSGISPVVDQTYTVVAKLDYPNQLASLYLDPDLNDDEASNVPVATYPHTSGNWSSAVRLASGSGGDVEWDNLRVAVNWESLEAGPPVVVDDQVTMRHLQKARIKVLDNDLGEFVPTSVVITTPPASGTATVSPDGTIVYEHSSGSPVSDQFEYQIGNLSGTNSTPGVVAVDFTTDARFDTNFADFPETPPASVFSIEEAFPGLNFNTPHGICGIPGGGGKLLVTEAAGRIFMIPDVGSNPTNADKVEILDISGQITESGERSMKGVAAHPDWENNGYIYVTYDRDGDTVRLSRFTCLTTAPYTASSELVLIDQHSNDNIHTIATPHFGADGYLYVGFGDEGTQEDGWDNSQHIDKDLWSCVIRIDVDKDPLSLIPNPDSDIPRVGGGDSGEANFRVPANNPFVGVTSFNGVSLVASEIRTEIYAMGVRNPWQLSPEDRDGDNTVDELWLGDVGRGDTEELNVFAAMDNGGWAWREGSQPGIRSGDLINGAPESAATLTDPYWEYPHGGSAFVGNSVTAGYIYQGTGIPSLTGHFIFGDFSAGNVWAVDPSVATPAPNAGVQRLGGDTQVVGFEPDPATGDILILSRGGSIKRVVSEISDAGYPQTLSDTNFFADLATLTPNPGGHAYDANLRFWSDHAEKKRWFVINDSADTMAYSPTDPWSYPAGMVWAKHFDYPTEWETFTRSFNGQNFTDRRPVTNSPRKRLETRFLVRNGNGAYGVSYRWNNQNGGSQTEATLADSDGESVPVDVTIDGSPTTVAWNIPSRSACMVCHTPEAGHSLSFNTRQLNAHGSMNESSGNYLDLLRNAGYVTGFNGDASDEEKILRPDEDEYSLEARVRSYLDVNCAYCHQDGGTGGGAWDGRHHLTLDEAGLVNAIPSDAPINMGDLLVKPGAVNESILYNRIAGANGYTRMPPLATDVVDLEAAQLVADWITSEVQPNTSYDDWRLAHFGDLTSPDGEKSANPDGDSGNNEFEWSTNTDPMNALSQWRPQISMSNGDTVLQFPALGNRSLRALHSEDLINWDYWDVPMNDGLPRNPATLQSLSGPSEGEVGFFRFEILER